MKYLSLFFICSFLFLSTQSFGQKYKNTDQITALKLHQKAAIKFQTTHMEGFTVDKDGILLPSKGYHIIYHAESGNFMIKPEKMPVPQLDKVDVQTDETGTTICNCGFGAGDNCLFWSRSEGNDVFIKCQGSCECGSIYIPSPPYCIAFQTAHGDWSKT